MTFFKGTGTDRVDPVVQNLANLEIVTPFGIVSREAQLHTKVVKAKAELTG